MIRITGPTSAHIAPTPSRIAQCRICDCPLTPQEMKTRVCETCWAALPNRTEKAIKEATARHRAMVRLTQTRATTSLTDEGRAYLGGGK